MLFYQVGELFQDVALSRNHRSIADLMDIRPDYANLVTENGTQKVAWKPLKWVISYLSVLEKKCRWTGR